VVAWPKADTPILIAAYTQGGTPTAAQIDALFATIGKMVAARLERNGRIDRAALPDQEKASWKRNFRSFSSCSLCSQAQRWWRGVST
jgi:hypothetical protein